jgi:hypothetical protein
MALGLGSGCAGLGRQLQQSPLPPGAPDAATIVESLAANDEKIQNFRAAGTFTLQSPKLDAVEKFPTGSIAFRKPDELFVEGRLVVGIPAFRLVSVGSEFLIEFPRKRNPEERYFYRLEGETLESVPFSVSPADVAREMFTPVDWFTYDRDRIRIVSYDETYQTAMLELGPRRRPERRLTVQGSPWVVVRNERLDERGEVIADTTLSDHHEVDGIRFPAYVDAQFPGEQTRMTFEMRNIRMNTDQVSDDLFTFKWRPSNVEQSDSDESRGNRGHLKPQALSGEADLPVDPSEAGL